MKKNKKRKIPGLKVPKVKVGVPARVPRPHMPERLKRRRVEPDAKLAEAIQNLPRITNETVAEHREEVLSSARKYIYPLSHSKRRVVIITTAILVLALVAFFTFCSLALYRFKSTSSFIYGVTEVVPFPVAKVGSSWVSYESYLFELRHSVHYYQTQQKENFSTKAGKAHMAKLEQDALSQVTEDAYVKQLASKHHVSVSNTEVDNQVALLRSENRLGSNDEVFRNVLSEFWGWTPNDFKRELKQQLLAEKVVAQLDTGTQARAQDTLNKLNAGTDFGTLAQQVSDDLSTKANGGNYGVAITQTNQNLPVQVVQALFKLQPGQISGIINTGYSLEIDKVLDSNGSSLHAAHIVFNFKPLSTYLQPLQLKEKPHNFINVN